MSLKLIGAHIDIPVALLTPHPISIARTSNQVRRAYIKLILIVASIFVTGWMLLGPVIIPIIVLFFLNRGRSENVDLWVPLLSSAMVISLGVGFFVMKALQFWQPASEILEALRAVSALRLVPSSLSSAVSSGQEAATIPFVMEQIGGLLALVFGLLVYRNPSILYNVVDETFDRAENLPNQSPWSLVVISFLLSLLFLFAFYYFPDDNHRLTRSAFVLSMLPSLLFACCYVCVFSVLRYKISSNSGKIK